MVFYRFSIVVPQVFNRISTGFQRLFIDVIGVLLICQSCSDVLSQGARRKKKKTTPLPSLSLQTLRQRAARAQLGDEVDAASGPKKNLQTLEKISTVMVIY